MSATTVAPRPAEILDEPPVQNLLVPVDDSRTTEIALATAIALARHHRAAITLLAVVPEARRAARRWATIQPGVPLPAATQEAADADAHRRLREAVRRVPHDIPVTTMVRHGQPGPEIIAELGEREYDAVMLGTPDVPRGQPARNRRQGRARPVLGPVPGRVREVLV